MDKKQFAAAMAVLSENFDYTISREKMIVLWNYLSDIPLNMIQKGINRIILEKKYKAFPTIAEIRNACNEDPELKAIEAWAELEKNYNHYYFKLKKIDYLTHVALSLTIPNLRADLSNIDFDENIRNRFCWIYQNLWVEKSLKQIENKKLLEERCEKKI
jgi:hypothetical protein